MLLPVSHIREQFFGNPVAKAYPDTCASVDSLCREKVATYRPVTTDIC